MNSLVSMSSCGVYPRPLQEREASYSSRMLRACTWLLYFQLHSLFTLTGRPQGEHPIPGLSLHITTCVQQFPDLSHAPVLTYFLDTVIWIKRWISLPSKWNFNLNLMSKAPDLSWELHFAFSNVRENTLNDIVLSVPTLPELFNISSSLPHEL